MAGIGGAIAAAANDDPVIAEINALLDERIRPFLASDGGWLEAEPEAPTASDPATAATAAAAAAKARRVAAAPGAQAEATAGTSADAQRPAAE